MSDSGPLTALKTTLEVRAGGEFIQVYVVQVPVKLANEALKLLGSISELAEVDLQHLRRFARLDDLPHHLRCPPSESSNGTIQSESASADLYLLVGPVASIRLSKLEDCLTEALPGVWAHGFGVRTVAVPLLAPTSAEQARSWSTCHWPVVYKKSNPFGPHPSVVSRAEAEIIQETHMWIGMAMRVAKCSKSTGYGEATGAVIVERGSQVSHAVALAGDGRWGGHERNGIGNPMAHAVLRAIGMVARKLKAIERTEDCEQSNTLLSFCEQDLFLDHPLMPEERAVYDSGPIPSNDYLCHGLEIYITHEPCVACSMALLHSRFARVIFGQRMPRTGGLCSEVCGPSGLGHGLFWRKDLNWSMLAWQTKAIQPELEIDSEIHV